MEKSRVYIVKSIYDKLNEVGTHIVSSSLPETFWKALWKLNTRRIKLFFFWKCLHNLATNAKLFGKVKDIDPSCPMCGEEMETIKHLVIHFRYALGTRTKPNKNSIWFIC